MYKTMISKQMKSNAQVLHLSITRKLSVKSQTLRRSGFGRYALLSIPITTFCLGTWQVKRRTWKLNLIEEIEKKSTNPPIELPNNLEDLSELEYQKVHVRGKFDHSKEMFIGPRPLIDKKEENRGILSMPSQSGNLVITPFHISDKNITVLVNRGWVPRNKTDASTRSKGQVTDEIDLIATIRRPEKRPQFSPKTNSNSNYFHYRDVFKMAQMVGAAPVFLDADAESTIPGGPIGGQTRVTLRNEHLSYIITWYSLSAATFYLWFKRYIRSPK